MFFMGEVRKRYLKDILRVNVSGKLKILVVIWRLYRSMAAIVDKNLQFNSLKIRILGKLLNSPAMI